MQVELVKCCGISHEQYLQLVIQQRTHEVREEQEMGVNSSLFLKILQLECEKKITYYGYAYKCIKKIRVHLNDTLVLSFKGLEFY